MDGFFEFQTAVDLRAKLRRDFAKVEANPVDADAYFNFFVTADSMRDWVHTGDANQQARSVLRLSSPYLRVCYHLANAAKHRKPGHKSNDSVEDTDEVVGFSVGYGTSYGTGYRTAYGGGPSQTRTLMVDLIGHAATELSSSVAALELAREVMKLWDAYPLDEAPPVDPAG